jgi:ABC-type nitrate/sulfonate/bicarbonate transport system ATPase subunit
VRRVAVKFANLDVEFVDREVGLGQVATWAERGALFPVVIFGPEGCGKSAFLRQAAEVLRGFGYDVVYVDVSHRISLLIQTSLRWLGGLLRPRLRSPALRRLSLRIWR